MSNRDFYKQAFSHLHTDHTLDLEGVKMKMQKKENMTGLRCTRRLLVTTLILVMILAMAGISYAATDGAVLEGLESLCQTDAPPQRGRTTAEKILAIYAFRALKSPVFRGFSGMVGEVVGGFIIYPAKRCSKCVEMDKKEHRTQATTWPPRPVPLQ